MLLLCSYSVPASSSAVCCSLQACGGADGGCPSCCWGRVQPGAAAQDHQTSCTYDLAGERPWDDATERQGLAGITRHAQCLTKQQDTVIKTLGRSKTTRNQASNQNEKDQTNSKSAPHVIADDDVTDSRPVAAAHASEGLLYVSAALPQPGFLLHTSLTPPLSQLFALVDGSSTEASSVLLECRDKILLLVRDQELVWGSLSSSMPT